MKKSIRIMDQDILYGKKHRLAAHETSKGRLFWPLPGGEITFNKFDAVAWTKSVAGVGK